MTSESIDTARVREYLLGLQRRIVAELERLDGRPFEEDRWDKPADSALAGSGITRILEQGQLLDRAGVGFPQVAGTKLPASASARPPHLAGRGLVGIGVSRLLAPG